MKFNMLGPLRVMGDDGTEIRIKQTRQRALLAVMLLHPNQPINVSRLADALWGDDPPAGLPGALRTHVWALRQALAPATRLHSQPGGYQLEVHPGELDLTMFRVLAERGRNSFAQGDLPGSSDLLTRALTLWRDPALADVPPTLTMEAEARRLIDERQMCRELLTEVRLALCEHGELLPELRAYALEEPTNERLWEQLMLALYRSGRQAEGLAVYHLARRSLARELGVEPGHALLSLHERILARDPGLMIQPKAPGAGRGVPDGKDAAAGAGQPGQGPPPRHATEQVVPQQLPRAFGHFLGRAPEMAALDDLLEAAAGSAGTAVTAMISGTAGVGKTALAVHWAHQVSHGFPDGQLYVDLRGFHPSDPPVSPKQAIQGFLGALAVPPDQIPADLAAMEGLYRSLTVGRRMLIILDNAHDAGQVRPLLPGSGPCLVVVTSRSQLTGLVAIDGAYPLHLDVLSQAESRELIARRIGHLRVAAAPDEVMTELAQRCAYLPLALNIAGSRILVSAGSSLSSLLGHLKTAQSSLDALDTGDTYSDLRAVFSWSEDALSSSARRMFRLLGVHWGPDISAAAAASLAGSSREQARDALAELTHANLLTEHFPGRFTFHDLLRAYAIERARNYGSDAYRQAAERRVLDHYLHTAHSAALQINTAFDAIVLQPAAAGVRPENLTGEAGALGWLEAEREVLIAAVMRRGEARPDACTWELASMLTDYFKRRGYWDDWAATQQEAVKAAVNGNDVIRESRAHRSLGSAFTYLGVHRDAQLQLHKALVLYRRVGDTSGQARVHQMLSLLFEREGRYRLALRHARRCLRLSWSSRQAGARAIALNTVAWCHSRLGAHDHALSLCQQALGVFRELDDKGNEAATWDTAGHALDHLGRHHEAADSYRRALTLFRANGDRFYQAQILSHLGDAQQRGGNTDGAASSWREALTILEDLRHPDAEMVRGKLG